MSEESEIRAHFRAGLAYLVYLRLSVFFHAKYATRKGWLN